MAIRTPSTVYRDYETDGVPSSGEHEPLKSEIRALLTQMQITGGSLVVTETKADLDAIVDKDDFTGGLVLNDPTATNNGYYIWETSAWTRQRGLPDTLTVLTNIGGTSNAITADTASGVDPAIIQAIVLTAPPGTNTPGGVTITLNSGTAEDVKAASGTDPAAGDIVEDVATIFFKVGTEWRQIFTSNPNATFDHQGNYNAGTTYTLDQVVTGTDDKWYQLKVASATGDDPVSGGSGDWLEIFDGNLLSIADRSLEEIKLSYATVAKTIGFDTVALFQADVLLDYSALVVGDIIMAGGYRLDVIASGASDNHLANSNGTPVKVKVLKQNNTWPMLAFNPNADGTTDDKAKIDLVNSTGEVVDLGGKSYEYNGIFAPAATFINGSIIDDDREYDFSTLTSRKFKDGLFVTDASLGHRAGDFVYKYQNGRGELVSSLDAIMPAGWRVQTPGDLPPSLTAYYVSRNGNDANSGADWANALEKVSTAAGKSDVDVIFVEGDMHYTITEGLGVYTGTRDIAIIAVGKPAIMSPQRERTWSAGTEPNTFTSGTTGGTPTDVIDARVRDEFGVYTRLTNVATEALVSTTPGSYTINGSGSGSTVTVRLSDDATPDNDSVWIYRGFDHRFSGTGCKMYLRNFIFPEGFSARNSDVNSTIALEDCEISNQVDSNGLQWLDVGLAVTIRCKVAGNYGDGIDYSEFNSLSPHGIEIDNSVSRQFADSTSNGSTAHDSAVVVRINTAAYDNTGPGFADVGSAKSYNIGCTSNYNGLTSPSANAYGFIADNTTEIWLHGFTAAGNAGTPEIVGKTSATIHYKDVEPRPVAQDSATVTLF